MGIQELLDRYQGRISAQVAEDSGGRFDIPLVVDGIEIANINLRSPDLVQLYRDHLGNPAALNANGDCVPLPA
jgi:hypothetical protein